EGKIFSVSFFVRVVHIACRDPDIFDQMRMSQTYELKGFTVYVKSAIMEERTICQMNGCIARGMTERVPVRLQGEAKAVMHHKADVFPSFSKKEGGKKIP